MKKTNRHIIMKFQDSKDRGKIPNPSMEEKEVTT